MEVIVSPQNVDLQECDFLVCGFFSDERPLRGSTGLVDWRLNGRVSKLLRERKITGEWKEVTLIPTQKRILPKLFLLFGFGNLRQYSYLRVREISMYILNILNKLNALNICLSLPYSDEYNVDCGKLVEVLLEGIGDCLDKNQDLFKKEWIETLRISFAEGEEKILEILLGVQTAKSILKDRLEIKILTPSNVHVFNMDSY